MISDLGTRIVAEAVDACVTTGVVALAYDHTNTQVTGMLLGATEELLLGGKVPAFYSHIARLPDERDSRLRGREGNRTLNHSFSLGDFVQQLGTPTNGAFAAVVRVLYSRRASVQARRMLILVELDSECNINFEDSDRAIFFPASWSNWAPVSNHATLTYEDMQMLNGVRARAHHSPRCIDSV